MPDIVVVTGAGAGVGRAIAREFARHGDWVALIGRDPARLADAVEELERRGIRAHAYPADVADFGALDKAAEAIESDLGPISIWVNNAMATVFSAVQDMTPEEFKRATDVTYLGTVYGTMAALRRMRPRNHGTIINIGSALAYRSVPLQAAYCGAKSAIRGFTDSLRSELIHNESNIKLTMVHLPAMNTPQFAWAKNNTGHAARPMPPIYQPEVAARAVLSAAHANRREIWVGFPTLVAIMANRIAPAFADRYLAKNGYSGQLMATEKSPQAPSNLFDPVQGHYGARGSFSKEARSRNFEMFTTEHRFLVLAAAVVLLLGLHRAAKRLGI